MVYCTYLTIYRGSLLPPFYIGFGRVSRIQEGYHGSVSSKAYKHIWLRELKKNPDMFETRIISLHETSREANERERQFQKRLGVVLNPLYINKSDRPHPDRTGVKQTKATKAFLRKKAREQFLTKEARAAHGEATKRGITDESRRKMSEAAKKRTPWNKGKPTWVGERKARHRCGNLKGRKRYNNGFIEKLCVVGTQPEGWKQGGLPRGSYRKRNA